MAGANKKYTTVESIVEAIKSGSILKATLYNMAYRYAKKGDLDQASLIREALKQTRNQ